MDNADPMAPAKSGRYEIVDTTAALAYFQSMADECSRYVARLTSGDLGTADDILQDTFVTLLRLVDRDPPVVVGPGWMFAVARSRFLDDVRRRTRDDRRLAAHCSVTPVAQFQVDEESDGNRNAQLLLASLPGDERLALALQVVDGLTIAEVAQILGRSVDATTSLLARARRRLRRHNLATTCRPGLSQNVSDR